MRADQQTYRIIVNKIENELGSLKNITLPCCGDRGQSRDVRRSNLLMQLKPLEAGGRGGGHGVRVFYVLLVRSCWSVVVFLPCHIFVSIMLEWYDTHFCSRDTKDTYNSTLHMKE